MQVTEDSNLDVAQSVTLVQKIVTEYRSHITTLTEQWEIWQQRVSSSQQFKVQWHQFIQEVRKVNTFLFIQNKLLNNFKQLYHIKLPYLMS